MTKHPKWERDLVERIADRFARVFVEEIEKVGGKATIVKPKVAQVDPKDYDRFPTNRITAAYKRGILAAKAGKPITACRCRTLESIADWRLGWNDAAPRETKAKPRNVKPIGFDLSKSKEAAKKLAKVDPEDICKQYREAVRSVYGDAIARESRIYYGRGWYYINVARVFGDGSIGVGGVLPSAYRLKEVLKRLAELKHNTVRDYPEEA